MSTFFITRVELHEKGTEKPDYDTLHKEMESRSFSRKLTLDKVTRHLPTAEYIYFGEDATTIDEPLRKAVEAARAASIKGAKEPYVLVTHGAGIRQSGLDEVKVKVR